MEYLRVSLAIGLLDHTWIERTVEIVGGGRYTYIFGQIKEFPESFTDSIRGMAIEQIRLNNGLDGLEISHFALLHWEIFEK